jgi:hypothetical protein
MGMVLSAFSQSIMLHRAFADLRGQPVSLGESLRVACSRFFSAIGLSMCTTSIEGIGLLCFIFPALMLTRNVVRRDASLCRRAAGLNGQHATKLATQEGTSLEDFSPNDFFVRHDHRAHLS